MFIALIKLGEQVFNPFAILFNYLQEKNRTEALNYVGSAKTIKGKNPKLIHPKLMDKTVYVSDLIK
jgi:hypothetical protein